ncbi:MAG: DNA starvation/stationary phase protection protein Dps [Halioglobus sp.]|nr:DNA starvation/stationary phase protection protein Dps [Halioglobus sp.]
MSHHAHNETKKVANFTAPGLKDESAEQIIGILDARMVALIDLSLTLKHVHWNVVGPNFIGVHEMLDPQVSAVREMTDTIAERIATLGGVPVGTPQAVAERRSWDDYSLGKALVTEHLGALDVVYTGLNSDHRKAIAELGELDPVSEDMLIGQLTDLEQFQWFIRAHLESASGELATAGEQSEKGAARAARS